MLYGRLIEKLNRGLLLIPESEKYIIWLASILCTQK